MPTHKVTSAVPAPLRSNSSSAVLTSMAPVAPSGWPRAIAPPLTLIRSWEMFSTRMYSSTTDAKASLSSNRSMSATPIPARLRARKEAGAGPSSMMVGSEPMEAKLRIRARGLRPRRSPASRLPTSTAAAPSTIPEELPAVCTWSISKTSGYFCKAMAS
ncbi:hypothetical protein D9M71_649230 [compost metagenome]